MKGRPLRFAGSVIAGWTVLRVGMLWVSTGSLPQAIDRAIPVPHPRFAIRLPERERSATIVTAQFKSPIVDKAYDRTAAFSSAASPHHPPPGSVPPNAHLTQLALAGLVTFGEAHSVDQAPSPRLSAIRPLRAAPDRWQASGWIFYRPGSTGPFRAGLPTLGGSQAGVRAVYALDKAAGLGLSLRAASPLSTSGAEAMAGIAWQPLDIPVTLLAEERFGLDHQASGPSISVVGGTGPAPIAPGISAESYGEVGVVFRDKADYFAGGSLRLAHQIAQVDGHAISLGTGAWGGIQRGTRRLDIGPSLATDLALGDHYARLSLEWRQRIAGNAAPGSGLALTLGANF